MNSYEEGQKLFELGMMYASQYRCSEAIKYYTLSIQAHENPAPYINRANVLGKRIRHFEALQDILAAKRIDGKGNSQFSSEIARELALERALTHNYSSGLRGQLINDLEANGEEYVATRIICASFDISPSKWEHSALDNTFLEYHFFNEIDNIGKFDDLEKYPEAKELLELYPAEFISHKVHLISRADLETYQLQQHKLHAFLCSYDEGDMQRLRRRIMYRIEGKLLSRDFGWNWNTLNSECEGITLEAAKFIAARS